MARRRRKLRSLVLKEAPTGDSKSVFQISIFIALLFIGILAICWSNTTTVTAWTEFLTAYRNQYMQIVHGENYCLPNMDIDKLFSQISEQVLNQQSALSNIALQFRNDSLFTAISVAGTSGVGKSLFAQALKQHFPWRENTNIYSWSSLDPTEHKVKDVSTFLSSLSNCGRNLIIIDNLHPKDADLIGEYNRRSQDSVEQTKTNLIVVYIFNLITFTVEQQKRFQADVELIEKLENVKVIRFRKFDSDDLRNCIRHETENLNLTLDDDGWKEVIESIDVKRSGCKTVRSKVQIFGELLDI